MVQFEENSAIVIKILSHEKSFQMKRPSENKEIHEIT